MRVSKVPTPTAGGGQISQIQAFNISNQNIESSSDLSGELFFTPTLKGTKAFPI
jgi:hypothetical protein